jgi:glycosyltransferase involved in cell wall biosynthesis
MRVSVLIPVYNASATLPMALESTLRQRGVTLECVAVDDGSSDTSLACLKRYAERDARVRVLQLPHRGIVSALNEGLLACRGDFVARMDADDLMHRDRLAEQVALLERRPDLVGVGCHVRSFPRASLTEGRHAYERWLNALKSEDDVSRDAYVECPLAHPTLMLRREIFQEFSYRQRDWAEDYDLLLRLLGAGHRLGVVPRRRLLWRDSPERLSRRSAAYGRERFTALKAEFLAHGWLSGSERYILWGYGDTGKALCRALLGHCRQPSHVVEVHPGRIGQRIAGAPVIAPERLLEARAALGGKTRIVVSVAHPAPRQQVRDALVSYGLIELEDYVCAA